MVSGHNEIWSADLTYMREFSDGNKDNNYLLNVIDIFSKYTWSVPLKLKTGSVVAIAFESIVTKDHSKNCGLIKALDFTIKFFINTKM